MADFVSAILDGANEVAVSEVKERIPALLGEIDQYEKHVVDLMEQMYVTFSLGYSNLHMLVQRAQAILCDIGELRKSVDGVQGVHGVQSGAKTMTTSSVSSDVVRFKAQIGMSQKRMTVLAMIVELHETRSGVRSAAKEGQFQIAAERAALAERLSRRLETSHTEHRKILIDLCTLDEVHQLKNTLFELFRKHFNWDSTITNEGAVQNSLTLSPRRTVVVTAETGSTTTTTTDVQDVLEAMAFMPEKFASLYPLMAMWILDNLLKPAVRQRISVSVRASTFVLTIKESDSSSSSHPHYKAVFAGLIEIATFLNAHCNYTVKDTTFMKILQHHLSEPLSRLIVADCLVHTIPDTPELLAKYGEVVQDIEQLNRKLVDANLLSETDRAVLLHADNVPEQFVERACRKFLVSAADLIVADLHDTELVEVDGRRYAVSKSALQYLGVGERVIAMATKTQASDDAQSRDLARRLLETARDMFHDYPSRTCRHHDAMLQAIPQQVAIFHNNCVHMASVLAKHPQMKTVVAKITRHGQKALNQAVSAQLEQATHALKCSRMRFQLQSNCQELDAGAEKAVRQCLRQLEVLRTVWQKVLPDTLYVTVMADVLNGICQWIIESVLSVTDLQSTTSEQLVGILKLVLTRAPKLFENKSSNDTSGGTPRQSLGELVDISDVVPNWNRLCGVVFMLHASLADIVHAWCSCGGKGQSGGGKHAVGTLTADEMRKMVRAIFQNSELRDASLSKIK